MSEHHIEVRRTARYFTLGPPAETAAETWIVCHGYGQLARRFVRRFHSLDDGTRRIVAPEALNRYYHEVSPGVHGPDARIGATWMTREDRDREIADYVAYLDTLAAHVTAGQRADAPRIALGFSQGAATVSRWAALGSSRIDRVVLWGSGCAHDLALHPDVFRGAPVLLVAGSRDRWFDERAVEKERARLEDAGVPTRVLIHEGGHAVEPDALLRI